MNDVKAGNITIEGLSALQDRLMLLPDKMAKNILSGAIREGAKVIQKSAKSKIRDSKGPHKLKVRGEYITILPGNMRRMVRVKVDRSGTRQFKISYEVYVKNATAWYFRFQEFGTSRHAAQNGGTGFMRPAFEETKEEAVEVIKNYITERFDLIA